MTHEQLAQELTQKIHKHCPELLELSFGCKIKWQGIETMVESFHEDKFDGRYIFISPTVHGCNQVYLDGDTEILGHPITLEHVLKAIDAQSRQKGIYPSFLLAQGHEAQWQLGKPLSEQSEETIKWLNGVIV